MANELGFSEVIQVSRGEYAALGHKNPYILANTVEAFIGALYIDQGFAVAQEWIQKYIYSTLDQIMKKGLYVDPKSYLQEFTQEVWGVIPDYILLEESGADHNKKYIILASIDGVELGRGIGSSKKKGQQDAAENAISSREEWQNKITLAKKNI